jgi:Predicted enzyme related to lactoylglutathione lyase
MPTPKHGKICYIEIPAADIARSSEFYSRVFGWRIRKRGDGSTAFDDATGEVSGTWIVGRPPAGQPGLLIYLMVEQRGSDCGCDCRQRVRDCAADRRRCTGDHGEIPRPRRKRAGPLSGAGVRGTGMPARGTGMPVPYIFLATWVPWEETIFQAPPDFTHTSVKRYSPLMSSFLYFAPLRTERPVMTATLP